MKILVCISNVPDTTTKIKFKENNTLFEDTDIQWVINPWDELALTRAVELKEDVSAPINEVHVLNVGQHVAEATLKKCLAIGADKAFRIDTEAKEAYFTANQIADFVSKNDYNFIVFGVESGDYNGSSVGGMVAEIADLPSISSVTSLNFENDTAIIERSVPNGKEYLKANEALILVVQKGFAHKPRIPNMRGIMKARSKPLEVIPAIDSEVLTTFVDYEFPKQKGKAKIIDSENISELINLLSTEAKVL